MWLSLAVLSLAGALTCWGSHCYLLRLSLLLAVALTATCCALTATCWGSHCYLLWLSLLLAVALTATCCGSHCYLLWLSLAVALTATCCGSHCHLLWLSLLLAVALTATCWGSHCYLLGLSLAVALTGIVTVSSLSPLVAARTQGIGPHWSDVHVPSWLLCPPEPSQSACMPLCAPDDNTRMRCESVLQPTKNAMSKTDEVACRPFQDHEGTKATSTNLASSYPGSHSNL